MLLELFQVDQSLQWHVTLERFLTQHSWKSYCCESCTDVLNARVQCVNLNDLPIKLFEIQIQL